MKEILLGFTLVAAVPALTWKQGVKTLSSILESTAIAAPTSAPIAANGEKLYPTLKMLTAAQKPLAEAIADTITCSLQSASDPSKVVSATFNPKHLREEGVNSNDSLYIGNDAFSFTIYPIDGDPANVEVFFYENINVQDEVGNMYCELKDAQEFCQEPLEMRGSKVADFVCRRNR